MSKDEVQRVHCSSVFISGKPVHVRITIDVLAFGEVKEANMVIWNLKYVLSPTAD